MKKEHFKYIAHKYNLTYNELWIQRLIEYVDVGCLEIVQDSCIPPTYMIKSSLTIFVGLNFNIAQTILEDIKATEILFL